MIRKLELLGRQSVQRRLTSTFVFVGSTPMFPRHCKPLALMRLSQQQLNPAPTRRNLSLMPNSRIYLCSRRIPISTPPDAIICGSGPSLGVVSQTSGTPLWQLTLGTSANDNASKRLTPTIPAALLILQSHANLAAFEWMHWGDASIVQGITSETAIVGVIRYHGGCCGRNIRH